MSRSSGVARSATAVRSVPACGSVAQKQASQRYASSGAISVFWCGVPCICSSLIAGRVKPPYVMNDGFAPMNIS